MTRRVVLRVLLAVVVVAAAGAVAWTQRHRWLPADAPTPSAHGSSAPVEIQSVKLSDEAVRGLGLTSAPAKLTDYTRVIDVPGVVIDPPGVSDRAVTAPVAGVITTIHVFPGEPVRAGERLFTLRLVGESVPTAQAELYKAVRDRQIAEADLQYHAENERRGAVAPATVRELRNKATRLDAVIRALRYDLNTRGLTDDQVKGIEAGTFVTDVDVFAPQPVPGIVSLVPVSSGTPPFTYEVEELNITAGQAVTAGQTLLTLANHQALLIEGRAFEFEAPQVAAAAREAKPVGVEFPEAAAGDWESVNQTFAIRSMGNTIDPAARTFPFFVPLVNQAKLYERNGKTYLSWRYRPGQKVRLRVPVGVIPNVIVLPVGAVVKEGSDVYVFRQSGNVYDRKAVVVVAEDRLTVAIAPGNGIEEGVYVLQNNAAAVNRALKAMQARGFGGTGGKKGHWHADGTFHEEHD